MTKAELLDAIAYIEQYMREKEEELHKAAYTAEPSRCMYYALGESDALSKALELIQNVMGK